MLYIEEGEWKLAPNKVIYEQNGEKMEHYTNDKEWWEDFAAKWDHTEIIEFEDVSWSEEERKRLEEVQDVGEAYGYFVERYVTEGVFPDELEDTEERLRNHPMQILQLKKEDSALGQLATQAELEDITLGQKASDIELRLMALEKGDD